VWPNPTAGQSNYLNGCSQVPVSKTTFVDGTLIENFEKAILPNTKIITLNLPTHSRTNFKTGSCRQACQEERIAHDGRQQLLHPLNQQPVKLGIDLVAQSATKFIGGTAMWWRSSNRLQKHHQEDFRR